MNIRNFPGLEDDIGLSQHHMARSETLIIAAMPSLGFDPITLRGWAECCVLFSSGFRDVEPWQYWPLYS